MASLPIANDLTPPLAAEGLQLQQILSGQNLAELLTESECNAIGQKVIREVQIDEASRADWFKRYERNLDIAMQVVSDKKTFPWPGAANTRSPALATAAIAFNAEAYPVIVDGSNLVKGRVLGPDPDGSKRETADRIGQHMTWQLLYKMPGWEEDTDRLTLVLPIVGLQFRKTYYDSIENANRSETVGAEDFIINYWAKSIETAPRYTQVLHYYPYEVGEKIAAGQWLKVPIDDDVEAPGSEDEQALGEYYEQHRTLDLDKDGYPEHYVVTCTKEGKVARIVPCFGMENITVAIHSPGSTQVAKTEKLSKVMEVLPTENDPRWGLVGDIVKIERRQYFTKYGFIPAPDGSFYDMGFGDLLQSTTDTIDTLTNQMLDAATLANAGGGFVATGVNVRGGNYRFALGEFKRVDVMNGTALKDNFMPMPQLGPSPVSFTLLEMLVQRGKDITSSQDAVAGRAPPNQPATTTLAMIEQAGKVLKGIFKRIHRSFGQELRILRRLNRDYLDEEEEFATGAQPSDDPKAATTMKVGREDYADEDLDVVPVSDPSQISNMHRMARAQAMFEMFNGNPLINQQKLYQLLLESMGATDIPEWFKVPSQGPDPKMVIEASKAAADHLKAETDRFKAQADAFDTISDGVLKLFEAGLLPDAAAAAGKAMEILGVTNAPTDNGPGGVQPVDGQPGNGGVPPDAG